MPIIAYVATKTTTGSENYRKTLDKFGYDFIPLGLGDAWGGWRYRMQKYWDFCTSRPPEEILILTDADDVLAVRPHHEKELMQTYHQFQRAIVVGAERYCYTVKNCHPVPRYWADHADLDTQNRYVNAGTMMGPAGKLADLWAWMLASTHTDDQTALGEYVNLYPDIFALDTNSKIFYCHLQKLTYAAPQVEWQGNHIKSITDPVHQVSITPFFVHFAGNFMYPALTANLFGTVPQLAYNDYARGILGHAALPNFQVESNAVQVTNIIFWVLGAMVLVFFIVIVILAHQLIKKSRRLAAEKMRVTSLNT